MQGVSHGLNFTYANAVFFFVKCMYVPFTMRERHTQNVNETNDFQNFGRAKLLRYALTAIITGGAAAIIGPFGTYQNLDLGSRIVFWMSIVAIGWAQMLFIVYAARGFIGPGRLAGWPTMLIATLIGTVPILFEGRFLITYLSGEEAQPVPLWLAYINVFVLTFLFSLVQWMVVERWPLFPNRAQNLTAPNITTPASEETTTAATPAPIRLRRMPDGLSGNILCLQMEDHYLRVYTNEGNGLVLQRLSDAVEELAEANGTQVHRSWWVARSAVEKTVTDNRQKFLILSNEVRVPVSRSFLPKLKEAGWLG